MTNSVKKVDKGDEKRIVYPIMSGRCRGNVGEASARFIALVFAISMLFSVGVGVAWGYTTVYLNGNFTGNNWNQNSWNFNWWYGASDGKYYIPVYATGSDQYWRLRTNNAVSPYTDNYVLNVGDAAYHTGYNGEKNFKYTGNAGIIKICIDQTSDEWSPWVWLERPTIKIKHPWNGGSWTEQDATDNNDGTYSYKGQYGGTDGFNAGISGDLKYKESSTTVTGSPATGDYCLFTWNASGYQYATGEGNNTGTFTIVRLYSITYDGNGNTDGDVPDAVSDVKWNVSTTVAGNTGSLVKTGYIFDGWNTAPDGSGDPYDADDSFSPSATSTTLYAQWISTVTVTHTLTNVTKTSGATTAGGSDYTAVYAANTGYSLPTPTVTIGGNAAISGTDYTWTAGTGTLTIPADKITGNIVITLNSATEAPSNVSISGAYHYFPDETISLTATPTGGNGPKTYQWYHGGTSDGDAIEGATSATYSKATCTFADAGSYYCKVTCGVTESTTSAAFDVKMLRIYVKTGRNGEDYGNVDFVKVDGTTATALIALGSNWNYGFNIADGCGHYFGNTGTMTVANCTNWTMNVTGTDCLMRTTNGATYTFTVDYTDLTAPKVSITYPVENQAADKVIYFDNQTVDWSNLYYRVGRTNHTQATAMTKVSGTNNLYKVTTAEYIGFSGWHIANNTGETGTNKSIYQTTTGDDAAITYATAHEGGAVTAAAVTVTPTTSKGTGSDEGINDNCTFYNYNLTTGMKTDRVTISDYANGTVTVNYVNTSDEASSFTSGYEDLAHTVILTSITAEPDEGYDAGAITINGGAYSDNYVVTGATTIAVPFTLKTYTVTYKAGTGGITGSHEPDTKTHGVDLTLPGQTFNRYGYTQTAWATSEGGSAEYELSGTYSANAAADMYPVWTQPITLKIGTAGYGADKEATATLNATSLSEFTAHTVAGYALSGYYTAAIGGTKVLNADGSYADANVTGYITSGKWSRTGAAPTLYAQWTENTYTVTYNANGGSGSMSNTVGHYVALRENTYTKGGCLFSGWNTATDGSGTSYSEGEEVELTADLTLYAQWKTDYSVTWGNVQIGGTGDAVTPNLGGGNYTITATIASWTGSVEKVGLTGITDGVSAVISGTTASPSKTVTVTFGVGADVAGGSINLSIHVPADGSYGAKTVTKAISIDRCGGSATITPTLTWSGGLANDGTAEVDKAYGDADFAYVASTTANSLGEISYSSSDAKVATIHPATGAVYITGIGTTTVTATLAASGCYQSAAIIYTLTVNDVACADALGTLTTDDLGCNGIRLTVTGHDAEGATYQWYKDGAAVTDSTRVSYVAKTAGAYYVVVTNTCARASNTVRLQSREAATATALVDSFYVKNGRITPDIPLVQTTDAQSFSVAYANSGADITGTGFGGCAFRMDEAGIVYLDGSSSTGAAPTGMTVGDTTITITATGCGGNESATIKLTVLAATAKPSVAFVVDGTKQGSFSAANAEHSTATALYQHLNDSFNLTPQNIYSTTNEKTIREHYSQFDAILITDDASSKATPTINYQSEGYVNAIGALIDMRPILTMKTDVGELSNWHCVHGSSSLPNPRQYAMQLDCNNHEIVSGLVSSPGSHVWEETVNDETYRYVIMVDSTRSPYAGVAYNADCTDKPALQGFGAAAAAGLVSLGRISNGSLQACVEHQNEPAARMMLLGLTNQALPNALTNEGKRVISNALSYLLKTHMESLEDCSNYFTGGASGTGTDWSVAANWSKGTVPTWQTKVRILKPCELSGLTTRVAQIDIAGEGTSSTLGGTCSGSLTIAADGAVVVWGKVRRAVAPYFNAGDLLPTEPDNLLVKANSSGNGTLIFDNADGDARATVQMYSKAYTDQSSTWNWQYIGTPFSDVRNALLCYYNSWLYRWNGSGWTAVPRGGAVAPFVGYCITHPEAGHTYTMEGTLVATGTKTVSVGAGAEMVVANSWTAPIQISQLEDADFENLLKTVYFFNTGNDKNHAGNFDKDGGRWEAGTYVSVPIHASPYTGGSDSLISSMQGFFVSSSGSAGTLTLDYDRHVRPATNNKNVQSGQMHVQRRMPAASARPTVARLYVSGSQYDDKLVVLERGNFSDGPDEGWDGDKWDGATVSPYLYALNADGDEAAVLATPDMEGTLIGFRAGEDEQYTFSFYYDDEAEPLYLLDMETAVYTRVQNGNSYTFTCSDLQPHNRFILTRHQAPQTPTEVEPTSDSSLKGREKAVKVIYGGQLYLFVRGTLYDVNGKMVRKEGRTE